MRLLLEPHTVLSVFGRPGRIGSGARAGVTASTSEVVVSVVSLWEIAIRPSVGRLPIAPGRCCVSTADASAGRGAVR